MTFRDADHVIGLPIVDLAQPIKQARGRFRE